MKNKDDYRSGRTPYAIRLLSVALLTATLCTKVQSQSTSVDPEATRILKGMADCLGGLKQFSVDTQNTVEDLLVSGHRIDLDVSARTIISRPNMLRAERRGELIDQRFYYDGKNLTLWNPAAKVYATVPAPGTIEGTLDYVRDTLELILPASDLVYRNSYSLLMQDVTLAMVVGKAFINGTKCDHLLFSRPGVDFQVWVKDSGKPLPLKYIVTDTATPARLSVVTVMSNWNEAPGAKEADFVFAPPEDAEPIEFLPLVTTNGSNP